MDHEWNKIKRGFYFGLIIGIATGILIGFGICIYQSISLLN